MNVDAVGGGRDIERGKLLTITVGIGLGLEGSAVDVVEVRRDDVTGVVVTAGTATLLMPANWSISSWNMDILPLRLSNSTIVEAVGGGILIERAELLRGGARGASGADMGPGADGGTGTGRTPVEDGGAGVDGALGTEGGPGARGALGAEGGPGAGGTPEADGGTGAGGAREAEGAEGAAGTEVAERAEGGPGAREATGEDWVLRTES